jgi:hypothetical protein
MKMISRTFHAWLDYLSCLVFFFAPWALKFSDSGAATTVSIAAGALVLLMSLFTKYEGGMFRVVPMSAHLTMDVLLGIFLIASPWLFAFKEKVYVPHLIMGILAVLAGLLTVRTSTRKPSGVE